MTLKCLVELLKLNLLNKLSGIEIIHKAGNYFHSVLAPWSVINFVVRFCSPSTTVKYVYSFHIFVFYFTNLGF